MNDQCFFHGTEPLNGSEYRVYRECGHAYQTERDLIAAWHEEVGPEEPPMFIYSCPLCSHDW